MSRPTRLTAGASNARPVNPQTQTQILQQARAMQVPMQLPLNTQANLVGSLNFILSFVTFSLLGSSALSSCRKCWRPSSWESIFLTTCKPRESYAGTGTCSSRLLNFDHINLPEDPECLRDANWSTTFSIAASTTISKYIIISTVNLAFCHYCQDIYVVDHLPKLEGCG